MVKRVNVVPNIELNLIDNMITIYGYIQVNINKELNHQNQPNDIEISNNVKQLIALQLNNSQYKPIAVLKIIFDHNDGDTEYNSKPFYYVDPTIKLSPLHIAPLQNDIILDTTETNEMDTLTKLIKKDCGYKEIKNIITYPRDKLLKYDSLDPINLKNRYN